MGIRAYGAPFTSRNRRAGEYHSLRNASEEISGSSGKKTDPPAVCGYPGASVWKEPGDSDGDPAERGLEEYGKRAGAV